MPEQVQHKYYKIMSDTAFKGKVKLPLVAQIEDYSKIVVVDQHNHLKIADKPVVNDNQGFSFSGFITAFSKSFNQIFPSGFHSQGHYLVSAKLFFNFARSGLFCTAYREIKFPVIVAMPIHNFQQIPGNIDITDHRGVYYKSSGGSIIESGIINLGDISITLTMSSQVRLTMSHNIGSVDNLDFIANVNIFKSL